MKLLFLHQVASVPPITYVNVMIDGAICDPVDVLVSSDSTFFESRSAAGSNECNYLPYGLL